MEYNDRDEFVKKTLEFIKNEDKESLYFIIPQEYTIKFTSYASMKNDLFFLIDATNKLIEIHTDFPTPEVNTDLVIEMGLWYSIIVTYAKLFMEAFDKRSKLEEKEVFENLDEESNIFYKTHKELMRDRHNFVAHRADSELDNFVVLLKLPRSRDLTKATFEVKTVRAYAMGTSYFVEYLNLFQKIFAIVDAKMKNQSDKLSKMILEKSFAFISPYEI
jgi:hypothetical protein